MAELSLSKLQAEISTKADTTHTHTTAEISGLGDISNAQTATKLETPRTIALTGDITGSASFDGSANISITTAITDDSHNHTIANVDGLQTALNDKLSISAGGTVNGNLTVTGAITAGSGISGVVNWTATSAFTGSTQGTINTGGTVGSGNVGGGSATTLNQSPGLAAGTYTLQNVIQNLINRSHTHGTSSIGSVVNCNCTCNCDTCFVAGSKVLMADGIWKNIEEVQIGDKVIGLNNKINTIISFVRGETNKMGKIENKKGTNTLYFTLSHNFWVKYEDKEVWGSNDKESHLTAKHDAMLYDSYDIKGMTLPYATIEGWEINCVQEVPCPEPVKVYNFKVDGSHSYIVNGYVVSGCACEFDDFDWNQVAWKGLNN